MIAKSQVELHCRTKQHWYKALQANGFYLCSLSSPFTTASMLKEIYLGDCYCPMTSDINVHNVLHPPTAEQLVNIIVTAIEENNNYANEKEAKAFRRLGRHMKRATPERLWLLGLLSTMKNDHEVF